MMTAAVIAEGAERNCSASWTQAEHMWRAYARQSAAATEANLAVSSRAATTAKDLLPAYIGRGPSLRSG